MHAHSPLIWPFMNSFPVAFSHTPSRILCQRIGRLVLLKTHTQDLKKGWECKARDTLYMQCRRRIALIIETCTRLLL